ncbi:hypothetical protein C479_06951 [Halovivax asiaticus JCM 14624]|uniref:ArsR family transcriptional regulator n=1 Tax=Halovivax asiaticus JCM 14624 TaxID=1227490 RepID=M0BL22_9EURY|nr:helix-turn-helix domain-containing protein [Halovivax asiaticus]ELZ11581.1 hypothetical protein C479_06951 [Halovivax asiaticus JCM 14624]
MLPTADGATWDANPSEAFATLGHETRLDVLGALWAADGPMRYEALRRTVAPDDRGNFGYHLDKLAGHFIRKSDSGYELRLAGEQVVRAIVAGTITANPELSSRAVDSECVFCGAPVELRYDDETITVQCTACAGLVGGDLPRGTFMHYEFPPGGLSGRSPEEIVDAAHTYYDAKIIPMMRGICPICAGQIETRVEVCEDHEPIADDNEPVSDDDTPTDELCSNCDSRTEAWAILQCERCRYTRRSVLWFSILTHPGVVAFYYDHGVDDPVPLRKLTWERAQIERTVSVDIVEREPDVFRICLQIDEEQLVAELGDDLCVRSVDRIPADEQGASTANTS